VLLTFGLLSPNKGIEFVIEALPAILARHPNVVYIVLGVTHPNLLAREGESYRIKLERLAEDRSVARNVIFYNRFVTIEELKEFIGAAKFVLNVHGRWNERVDDERCIAWTRAFPSLCFIRL
jgi:glycosyltransferase involved in cell wall biosynthesis